MVYQIPTETVYQVMTEQPDFCHTCGSRLMLLEIANIDDEHVYICECLECLECKRTIPVVEDALEVGLCA